MANAFDQAEASRLLRASLAIATYTAATSPVMLRLTSANGSATTAGTQVTGGSYTPQNLTTALGTEANGSVTNSGVLTYTAMPAISTVGTEIWDSSGTPRRVMWGALTSSKTTASGDSISFPASSVTASNNN